MESNNISNTDYMVTIDGKVYGPSGNEVKPQIGKNGSLKVGIWKNGRCKYKLVAHLVMEAFDTFWLLYDPRCIVIHKDGNKLNNHFDNLEAISREELFERNRASRYPDRQTTYVVMVMQEGPFMLITQLLQVFQKIVQFAIWILRIILVISIKLILRHIKVKELILLILPITLRLVS